MSSRHASALLALSMVVTSAAAQQHHSHEHHSHDSHAEHGSSDHEMHGAHPAADTPTPSERAHVPPNPPSSELGPISTSRMIELMQMDDDAIHWLVALNQLEAFRIDGRTGAAWEANAWIGTDLHKLVLKSDGERVGGATQMRSEVSWDRIISRWWSVQAGLRHDYFEGPSRNWLALGVQGLAPYFVEVEATLYFGESGRTALRLDAHTDWLLTQRLILQPQLGLNAYGKDDRRNGIGSGISDLEFGLRLRYEIIREVAPYVGVQWERAFGETAEWQRAVGHEASEVVFVAGIKAWF